tara:strand:+ start:1635 stop:3296 length:1662 start_codon:yes stop_codon:yes gene_type:complete
MKSLLLMMLRYWHTVRYLRFVQIVGRLQYFFRHINVDYSPPGALREVTGKWIMPARRDQSMLAERSFCFLNESHKIISADDWNNKQLSKLWLYNLHYFDDLSSVDAELRNNWHRDLIDLWIDENPVGMGNGWEPYPSSLRIVNWIKWALAGNLMEERWLHSLVIQVRFLFQNLETHLMGNHLFANAKALMFAGCFFNSNEAKSWRETGHKIIKQELAEQLLDDGGNFELSTMYHLIFLEDLLDLYNLHSTYGDLLAEEFKDNISSMFYWLAVMCHPDEEISFFNDAALGISPSVAEIRNYGEKLLGNDSSVLINVEFSEFSFIELPDSGYSRVQIHPMVTIIDRAAIGPDYLPGHAHADTLSFEMSLFGQRVIVNSGTSVYGSNADRKHERSTAAHSTVMIDNQDSSEVWSGFRVARRARVFNYCNNHFDRVIRLSACHDGYKRLSGDPVHCREWLFDKGLVTITDKIEGSGVHKVESILPLHPEIKIKSLERDYATIEVDGNSVVIKVDGSGELYEHNSSYHPEFGLSVKNKHLVYYCHEKLPIKIIIRIQW